MMPHRSDMTGFYIRTRIHSQLFTQVTNTINTTPWNRDQDDDGVPHVELADYQPVEYHACSQGAFEKSRREGGGSIERTKVEGGPGKCFRCGNEAQLPRAKSRARVPCIQYYFNVVSGVCSCSARKVLRDVSSRHSNSSPSLPPTATK